MAKQRTTLKLASLNAIDTDNLILQKDQVQIPASVYLKRQDRLTIEKDELPQPLQQLLENMYQFRIQWRSNSDESDELFQNFATKGLEIDLVPSILEYEQVFNQFEAYFSRYLPFHFKAENLISTATSATYHVIPDREITGAQLQKLITDSLSTFSSNNTADQIDSITHQLSNLDIAWSTESNQLSIKWMTPPHDIIVAPSQIKKELGLFQARKFDEEDLELTGLTLTIQDQDRFVEPSNTLLILKSRHQTIGNGLHFQFKEPVGLHPTLQISGLSATSKPYANCELFMFSHLQNSLIFDRYQYDEKSLSLINSWGENDLELPQYKVDRYGSIQLFQVLDKGGDLVDSVEIKYHSRYLAVDEGNSTSGSFELLTPSLFYACDSSENLKDAELVSTNTFDSYYLGYESFFEPSTNFYHFSNNQSTLSYDIPRGKAGDFAGVQLITFASVVLGTLALLCKVYGSLIANPKLPESKKDK
ncbi:hypothetical protein WICPIJ_002177 [Wickerhamomyces pijperi]|uniref:Protein PBN1 n=1 Tax=Wickerhamomyces pijperi TaxID=599730 RepID=A0A9P8QBY4_WICPI|nr:hypothetical protein WICPIJ_002177 [Wickerhamomyces pijperi]